jgi:DNA-binding transcriptional ArsR family regulator
MDASVMMAGIERFVYHQSMNAANRETTVSKIAAAIGEPTRARMLHALLDGHARTSTELAILAEVSPSTASVHLHRLQDQSLVDFHKQGKHRYYSLGGSEVANALEALNVIAGLTPMKFVPRTPDRLLLARTCYDHIAGRLGVLLHNRFRQMNWLAVNSNGEKTYEISSGGTRMLNVLGVDVKALESLRRKIAYPCLDWSERQPHIGGALGAALLASFLKRKWVARDLDSRTLSITREGFPAMRAVIGLTF